MQEEFVVEKGRSERFTLPLPTAPKWTPATNAFSIVYEKRVCLFQ